MVSIIIVDDHAIVRLGLRHLLLSRFPFAEIEEAVDAESFLGLISKRSYSIAILDLLLPGRSGIDVLKQAKSLHPKMPVLILTVQQEKDVALRALQSGASSFLNKETDPAELIKAISFLLSGKSYLRESVSDLLLMHTGGNDGSLPIHYVLSDREFEVMKHIACGESLSEIASKMSLSISSISTYRKRVLAKMNFNTNAEMTVYAMQNNWFL